MSKAALRRDCAFSKERSAAYAVIDRLNCLIRGVLPLARRSTCTHRVCIIVCGYMLAWVSERELKVMGSAVGRD